MMRTTMNRQIGPSGCVLRNHSRREARDKGTAAENCQFFTEPALCFTRALVSIFNLASATDTDGYDSRSCLVRRNFAITSECL